MEAIVLGPKYYLGYGLALVGFVLYWIVRRRVVATVQDGPILGSSDMLLTGGLQSLHEGEISGFKYNLLTNNSGKVMVLVELGYDTHMHLLAFGDRGRLNDAVRLSVSRKWLVPARLEGDFPDYFQLYCSPEKQIELREFFNPETMAQFIDFCRAYNLEIFQDSLFISQAEDANESDDTPLIEDVEEFLRVNANILKGLGAGW